MGFIDERDVSLNGAKTSRGPESNESNFECTCSRSAWIGRAKFGETSFLATMRTYEDTPARKTLGEGFPEVRKVTTAAGAAASSQGLRAWAGGWTHLKSVTTIDPMDDQGPRAHGRPREPGQLAHD